MNRRIPAGCAASTSATKKSARSPRSPESEAAAGSGSGRWRIRIAAIVSPAAHPRVRLSRPRQRVVGEAEPLGAQQHPCFALGEGEVLAPDLAEGAGQSVPVQRQPRVDPGDQDHPQLGAGVPEQEVDLVEHGRARQDVGIVEHDDDRLLPLVEGRGQPDQEGLVHLVRVRRSGHGGHRDAAAGQPGQQVGPEHAGLPVPVVEGDPGQGARSQPGRGPGADHRRLPGAGRGGHQGERPADTVGQLVEQALPDHDGRWPAHDPELLDHQRFAGSGSQPAKPTQSPRVRLAQPPALPDPPRQASPPRPPVSLTRPAPGVIVHVG